MGKVLIPVVLVLVVFLTQSFLARRYNWRCANCGQTFSLSPLKAALLPHRFGGRKLARCPHCGVRSWVTPVPKE